MKKRVLYVEMNEDGTVGGSYFSLLNMLRCLDRTQYQPLVMFYREHSLLESFRDAGLAPIVHAQPTALKPGSSGTLGKSPLRLAQKLYNVLALPLVRFARAVAFLWRCRVDLVHLNDTAAAGREWLLAARLLGKKCVTHQRGHAAFSRWDGLLARRFDRIICISESVRARLEGFGLSNNLVTLYNSIDPDQFRRSVGRSASEVRGALGLPNGAPLVGIVGNFQEWKGQLTVVRAVALLRQRLPGLVCLLVGDVSPVSDRDREFFERVKAEVAAGGLGDNVVFTGYRPDIPDVVNALDVLIHASIAPEPFGRVVLEGMCLQKPVVATDMGGPKEIIEHGKSGLLVPAGDPALLAEAVAYLIANPGAREELGKNALQRVEEKFSFPAYESGLARIYAEVLAGRSASPASGR